MDAEPIAMVSTEDEEAFAVKEPIITKFDLNGPDGKDLADLITIDERKREHQVTPMTELLPLHHKFNHISMKRMRHMAKCGALPRQLAECDIPVCSACMYTKATRQPWRSKSTKEQEEDIKPPTKPGDVVSVDQLRSPTPGLVAQMTKRYNYATVFVDQYSRLGYVYVQKTQSAEETLEAKEAFERYASLQDVHVKAYHADNGVFRANAWYEACWKNGQSTSFARVNAHHMNGIAERRIKELQEMTRASLAHANYRWSGAIKANLWPYTMRLAMKPSMQLH
jgi:transposase InsO family protein